MTTIKPSKFNSFFKYDDDNYIAYNAMSNALALIESSNYKKYIEFTQTNAPLDADLLTNLQKGSFIIEDKIDELKELKFSMTRGRFSNKFLNLIIAPTSDCNFRCIYCFEKDSISKTIMDKTTQDYILEFIKNRSATIDSLNVTWYGGEPLLAMDIIQTLSSDIIKLCSDNSISYSSSIITNGYNLTHKVAEKLKECQVSNVQITLDGDEHTHNMRRPLAGGHPTFQRIINNLESVDGYLDRITLRINVDKTNISDIYRLVDILVSRGITKTVVPYLGNVDNCNDSYTDDSCLDETDYLHKDFDFNNYISELGFSVDKNRYYPHRRDHYCSADTNNAFVINADGEMYKCWNDLGIKELSIGHISKVSSLKANNVLFDYVMYDPTTDPKCMNCSILPICLGGCPSKRIRNLSERCDSNKYILDKYLKSIARYIKSQKQT